jgi:hypothetical protein
MSHSGEIGTLRQSHELAHVLAGEPASISSAHALFTQRHCAAVSSVVLLLRRPKWRKQLRRKIRFRGMADACFRGRILAW